MNISLNTRTELTFLIRNSYKLKFVVFEEAVKKSICLNYQNIFCKLFMFCLRDFLGGLNFRLG